MSDVKHIRARVSDVHVSLKAQLFARAFTPSVQLSAVGG